MLHDDVTTLARHPRHEDLAAGWIEAMCASVPGFGDGSDPVDDRLFETLATMPEVAERWGTDVVTARRIVTLRMPWVYPSETYSTLTGDLMISLHGLLGTERANPGLLQGKFDDVISELERDLEADQQRCHELSGYRHPPLLDHDGVPILSVA